MFHRTRNISVYDVDLEDERQKQALLRYINRQRAERFDRPGLRPSPWGLVSFFLKVVLAAAIVWLALVALFSL